MTRCLSRTRHRGLTGLAAAVATVLLAGCAVPGAGGAPAASGRDTIAQVTAGTTVTVHKTATCECCGRYEEHLEAAGFTVVEEIHDDLAPVKARFGIPDDERSCHTNEVAGYAAEGHVPIDALVQLLTDEPDVDGISLAGMPVGSPGMDGDQAEPFVVRTFVDGQVTGELGRF